MSTIIERTVSLIKPFNKRYSSIDRLRLCDFENSSGYVLLGEPGIGKTTELQKEAQRVAGSTFVTARLFLASEPKDHPEWKAGPIFIDSLDEVRLSDGEPKTIVNEIALRLRILGNPQFRLSCRSVGWLGIEVWKEFDSLLESSTVKKLRLNPLDDSHVHKIIMESGYESKSFIRQAYEHEVGAFLKNPFLLKILLKSVKTGPWPDTLAMAFESACYQLSREFCDENNDYRFSSDFPSIDAILTAAGQLATYLLIANKIGWSLDNNDERYIGSIKDIVTQDQSALEAAISSGFFTGSHTCRTPIHRLMAEYLGGRYLHESIQNGLNPNHVRSLFLGNMGPPLPDLAGLLAWYVALNPSLQSTVGFADPIAIINYGGKSILRDESHQYFFNNLGESIDPDHAQFNDYIIQLIADNLNNILICELIDAPKLSMNLPLLMYTLLRSITCFHDNMSMDAKIAQVGQMKAKKQAMLDIVRDTRWKSNTQSEALLVLNLMLINDSERHDIYGELIMDIRDNILKDHGYQLLGTILKCLYPEEIHPTEVWDYLEESIFSSRHKVYLDFWETITANSNSSQIRDLLDSLCDQAADVIQKLNRHRLDHIVLDLLLRGLELYGDQMEIPELYRWFRIVEFDDTSSQLIPIGWTATTVNEDHHLASVAILNWLRHRPSIQYGLIEHALIAQELKIGVRSLSLDIPFKFVGIDAPDGFRDRCLNRAVELWHLHPKAAIRLAEWSVHNYEGWGDPLSDQIVSDKLLGISGLNEWNHRRLNRIVKDPSIEPEPEHVKNRAKFLKQKHDQIEQIRQQINELSAGTCSPALLHHLAKTYFGGFADDGEFQISHLESYLQGDEELIRSTLSGFRSLLSRDDLPSLEQIADLHKTKQYSYFALPFLAGMELENETILDRFSEQRCRSAIGFYHVTDLRPFYCNSHGTISIDEYDLRPWYEYALKRYPELVADSLVLVHNAGIQAKHSPNQHLFKMAFDKRYVQISPLAVERMFTVFPTRCNKHQRSALRLVLWTAILADRMSAQIKKIVLKRINRKKMDLAQRAIWIGAALHADRKQGLPALVDYLSEGQESRLRHLLNFLAPNGLKHTLPNIDVWKSKEILLLIQTFAKRLQLYSFQDQSYFRSYDKGFYGEKFESIFIPCFNKLSERCDRISVNGLDSLLNNSYLMAWKEEIFIAQDNQTRRCDGFIQPVLSIKEVQKIFM